MRCRGYLGAIDRQCMYSEAIALLRDARLKSCRMACPNQTLTVEVKRSFWQLTATSPGQMSTSKVCQGYLDAIVRQCMYSEAIALLRDARLKSCRMACPNQTLTVEVKRSFWQLTATSPGQMSTSKVWYFCQSFLGVGSGLHGHVLPALLFLLLAA